MRTVSMDVDARMDRITRSGHPHEWEVDIRLPGMNVPRKVGRIYEHRDGDRKGFEARLEVPGSGESIEIEDADAEHVDGLGFKYTSDAMESIVRNAVRQLAAEAIP